MNEGFAKFAEYIIRAIEIGIARDLIISQCREMEAAGATGPEISAFILEMSDKAMADLNAAQGPA